MVEFGHNTTIRPLSLVPSLSVQRYGEIRPTNGSTAVLCLAGRK